MGLHEADQAPTELDALDADVVAPTLWISNSPGPFRGCSYMVTIFGLGHGFDGRPSAVLQRSTARATRPESDVTVGVVAVRPAGGGRPLFLPSGQSPGKTMHSEAEPIC
jgi:hypothetical protein